MLTISPGVCIVVLASSPREDCIAKLANSPPAIGLTGNRNADIKHHEATASLKTKVII